MILINKSTNTNTSVASSSATHSALQPKQVRRKAGRELHDCIHFHLRTRAASLAATGFMGCCRPAGVLNTCVTREVGDTALSMARRKKFKQSTTSRARCGQHQRVRQSCTVHTDQKLC